MRTPSAPTASLLAAILALGCEGVARPVVAGDPERTRCTACHGDPGRDEPTALDQAAPPVAPGGRDPGAHLAHLHGGALRGPIACAECHEVPESTSHTNGQVELTFGAIASANGLTPSFSKANGTCAVWCHGTALAGGPAVSPSWTGGAEIACGACHATPPANHPAGFTQCDACHPGTVDPDRNIRVANGLHVNGVVDVAAAHADGWADPARHGAAAKQGLAACKGCHGAELSGGSVAPSCNGCHGGEGWRTDCTFCHGTPGLRASPPVDTRNRTDRAFVTVGAHARHATATLTTSIGCPTCHAARGDVVTDPAHIDGGPAEVVLSGRGAGAYARTSDTQATCTNYCHGGFAGGRNAPVAWTATAAMTCGSCHPASPTTGRHPRHLEKDVVCSECHGAAYTSAGGNGTGVAPATHVDGTKTLALPGVTFDAGTRRCNGTCHGEVHDGSSRYAW